MENHIEEETVDITRCQLCDSNNLTDAFAYLAEYRQKKCANCGFIFVSPRPTTESISQYYSHPEQYDSWIDNKKARDRMWKRRVQQLCKLHLIDQKKQQSILDVGTGVGQFLVHLRPFFGKLFGTEVSQSAITAGKANNDLKLFKGVVETIDFDQCDKFDVISMVHVLEHVEDPKTTVFKCKQILNDDGTLLVYLPNEILGLRFVFARFLRRIFAFSSLKFRPNFTPPIDFSIPNCEIHLSYFTPIMAKKLLQDCGFEIISIAADPYFPVDNSVTSLLKRIDYIIRSTICELSGLMFYDAFLVAARKKE